MSHLYLIFHFYIKAQLEKVTWKLENSSESNFSSPLTYDYCNDANWSLHKDPVFLSGVKWLHSDFGEPFFFLVIVEEKNNSILHPGESVIETAS